MSFLILSLKLRRYPPKNLKWSKVSKYGAISGPYFPVFGLNTEIYGVNLHIQSNLRIQSECWKMRTRNNSVFGHFSRGDLCSFGEYMLAVFLKIFLNPFHAIDLFWYPLKTSENLWFSDVFRGYQKRSVAWNGLKAWQTVVSDNFLKSYIYKERCV